MTTHIYIVLHQDRHADPEVHAFTTPLQAVGKAHALAHEFAREPADVRVYLTRDMERAGWIWNCTYSGEGDGIRVQRIELK